MSWETNSMWVYVVFILILVVSTLWACKRKKQLKKNVKSMAKDYSEIKKILKNWFEGNLLHTNVRDIMQERKSERSSSSSSNDEKEEFLFKKAFLYEIKARMVKNPFDLLGMKKFCSFMTNFQNRGVEDVNKMFNIDLDELLTTMTVDLTCEDRVVSCGIALSSQRVFVIVFNITVLFLGSFGDWVTDIIFTSTTAYKVWSYVASRDILFYMSTFFPMVALLFTSVLAIFDKPWQLLYYQWKISLQCHYAHFDKPELPFFKRTWHADKLDNYAVLNRYKFSLTQGGQESAIQMVIQWSTYFTVSYLVAASNALHPHTEIPPFQENLTMITHHINTTGIDTLDEENHYDFFLGISGFFSIFSLTMSQLTMLNTAHLYTTSSLFCFRNVSVTIMMFLPALLNSLSSSILLIHTGTRVLDIILLTSSSTSISVGGSGATTLLFLMFVITPGIMSACTDRFITHHQANIIEDDLWIKRKGISWICKIKNILSGIAKQILEGLTEKLRLPVSRLFSYAPKGYHTTCLNLNSITLVERFITQCVFYILFLLCNVILGIISKFIIENEEQWVDYVNSTDGVNSALPSEMSLARWVLEFSATLIVPGGWLLSTFLLYLMLQQTKYLELENMEFVYNNNEHVQGCFLSKKGSDSQCEVEEEAKKEAEKEAEKEGCFSSASLVGYFTSFIDVHPPPFDLSGKWIDMHQILEA